MNQHVATIDVATLTPATVFAPGGVEGIISKLETEVRAIPRDISTEEGRDAVKALAYKVARSKTALDEMGKELVSGIKAQAATIDAERRIIRDRCDALKVEVRGDLDAWEVAEAERIDGHEKALVWLIESDRFATTPTAAMIRAQAADVSALSHRDWQEFKERGDAAVVDAHAKLSTLLLAAEQAERDAAELAELRRLKAERDAADQDRLIEEARVARAAQDAEDARLRSVRAEEEKAEAVREAVAQAEARAERERIAAIEAEQRRHEQAARDAAAKKAAEEAAERKRQENGRHRAKIHTAIFNALTAEGMQANTAKAVFEALTAGRIPHISINY